ncbi:excinuclease ABC subunit C [Erysipelothrix sp. HDW6C]|uniref:excinuclease ABC subunit UvrC n=1 Tax=Erysipelothrix sp. HDW6C TaxID=2714930 RepID=UPI00140D52D6|nr:excinuclease ABC subunit UvrC [Erysipelothrix sp. HDW6C]QIK69883.1 excinuclease ABC subunit C [Erysipelothrix sp. HDW6C]
MKSKTVEEKLALLPTEPGCYMMKDKNGEIIYVGKAKKLKNRVSSYFVGAHDYKTTKMVAQIADFDIIITSTEKESLILEINLIKEHRPRFNILFMDDKSYPYLKVSRTGKPEVIVSRDKKHSPKFVYFGPYPDATAAREMASVLNDSIPSDDGTLLPNTQAIYASFNRTQKKYTEAELNDWRQNVISILNGNSKAFFDELERKMHEASHDMNFELAQNYKDKLQAIEYISDRQQVQFSRNEHFDMFHYAYYQGYIAIVGLFVRAGRLLERSMAVEASLEEPEDAFVSFIAQYYQHQPKSKQIYVPESINNEDVSMVIGAPVSYAQRGKKRALLEIAAKNAQQQLDDQFQLLRARQQFKDEALVRLSSVLGFTETIHRIEVFDNSHISGTFAVSACVVFDDGEPNKSQYRRYRLNQGNDDVASMKEVLYRRYFRILKEGGIFPDLILVDGGKPQLNAALEIMDMLDLDITVAGLVKDDRHRTHALLRSDGKEIDIDKSSSLFALMTHMQDEVHRYVIGYHRLLRKKAMTKSILDEVPGLGPKRQKQLYKEFGSLRGIRNASKETLKTILPSEVAEELYDIIHIDWDDYNEKN